MTAGVLAVAAGGEPTPLETTVPSTVDETSGGMRSGQQSHDL